MTDRQIIATENAPAAIGTYSQAVRVGDTVYISGQIPLDPATMEVCSQVFADQTRQVFDNLAAVAKAAGGDLSDIVKLSIFMTDLSHFPTVNEIMADYFQLPYPARAAVGVKELPKAVQIEMEAIMVMGTIK
ncbi:MAG: reactive intermediate/imine deaminase [Oceanospirillaceae bacterium]|nr:reactive intermediate/imine deaminase [Oceanospirillaceae bacterium]HCI01739.1 reactive intermediate/imine deaminase [Oceanospirillaceae bacterium]|tara:strand:+ start:1209 stop:1604 length:396 start_codon:yes stop_codon:yes gene_type:complete